MIQARRPEDARLHGQLAGRGGLDSGKASAKILYKKFEDAAVRFRWNQWNVDHIATHGVTPKEAERVVERARRPYPEVREDDKWRVVGRGSGGRWLQVVFVLDPDDVAFVIHARPLTEREKRRERKKLP
jgi:uncharacterized DUF497 family protein